MTEANTKQAVECPICEEEFDPTVAGGWCTNTECGEWQHTDGGNDAAEAVDDAPSEPDDGDLVSPDESDATDSKSVDLFSDVEGSADEDTVETESDAIEDDEREGGVDDDVEEDDAVEDDATAEDADAAADEDAEAVEPEAVDPEEVDSEAEEVDSELEEAATEAEEADSEAEAAATEAEEAVEADEVETAEPEVDAAEADSEAEEADEVETAALGDDEDDAEAVEADADDAEAATIDCVDCGAELDADANFCVECGADVSAVTPGTDELEACPGCGADVEPEDNFCVECGEDLAAHRDEAAEDHEDAIDALEATDDDGEVPESLVLAVEGREIAVDDGDTVGREIRAALTEAGRPDDEAVRIHREHVRFVRESDSFYLLDLGDNPTQLNGQSLQKGDREPVGPGDELELSGVASVSVRAA